MQSVRRHVDSGTLPNNFIYFQKINDIVYWIVCLIWHQRYIGKIEVELHRIINRQRFKPYDENKANSSFEIAHFGFHSFSSIRIEILEQLEDKNGRLSKENDYMLIFRTVYIFELNTLINNININKVENFYDLLNKSNAFTATLIIY